MGPLRLLLTLSVFVLLSVQSHAQVLFVQWSDVHSSLKTLTQQMLTIDHAGQDFLQRNPQGEVVVVINGDFTSINPSNIKEGGWISMDAVKILKERGYTLLFIPGNHDAFDWTVRINGADLFLEQMSKLKSYGVIILAENFRGKNPDFERISSPSYRLKTLKPHSRIVGLTIPTLISKSNLNEVTAAQVFTSIETYRESAERILPELARSGVQNVFWAIHQGHVKLKLQVLRVMNETISNLSLSLKTQLMMGGHDHQVASYRVRGTHISDAGSYGSLSLIEVTSRGEVLSNRVKHIAISPDSYSLIKPENFQMGQKIINPFTEEDILKEEWLKPFHNRVSALVSTSEKRLGRVLGETQGVDLHKMHLKQGPNELGHLLAESLVAWAKTLSVIRQNSTPLISMVNSSSYRLESPIPAGLMTELTFRNMYPYNNEATLYFLKGQEIKDLYFSLRETYGRSDRSQYSPHLNREVKEEGRDLWLKEGEQWKRIDPKKSYWVVFDGWLSNHRFEQSYKIPLWIETFARNRPRAARPFQDILVKFMPSLIENHERLGPRPLKCQYLFQPG